MLIDFGSTYTKLTAVDVDREEILGTAQAFTTVATDINEGLNNALSRLEEKIGKLEYSSSYACSSAAGGLRMITSGLVPELTGEAAKLASLGAGAKVVGVYAFQLTEDDLDEIKNASPDIFLLVGGTDGGNVDCIIHNAKMIATLNPSFPIIIAGNRTAVRECERILTGCEVYVCPNVMPKFGTLNIEPTQKKIREIFLDRIVEAKGLGKAKELLSDIMMPTPSAVLAAMELHFPVFGMVKDDRHRTRALVTPDGKEIRIDNNQSIFSLIGNIQEETHRFAITYHRQLRSKRLRYSELDKIPGIGPKRKQDLLRQFKSLTAIGQATLPELERILPKDAAAAVYHHFREKGEE